jgi:hypothetical protein
VSDLSKFSPLPVFCVIQLMPRYSFGDQVTKLEQAAVKTFVTNLAMEKIPSERRGIESVIFSRNLVLLTSKGSTLFWSYFDPESLSSVPKKPSITPGGKRKVPFIANVMLDIIFE